MEVCVVADPGSKRLMILEARSRQTLELQWSMYIPVNAAVWIESEIVHIQTPQRTWTLDEWSGAIVGEVLVGSN